MPALLTCRATHSTKPCTRQGVLGKRVKSRMLSFLKPSVTSLGAAFPKSKKQNKLLIALSKVPPSTHAAPEIMAAAEVTVPLHAEEDTTIPNLPEREPGIDPPEVDTLPPVSVSARPDGRKTGLRGKDAQKRSEWNPVLFVKWQHVTPWLRGSEQGLTCTICINADRD